MSNLQVLWALVKESRVARKEMFFQGLWVILNSLINVGLAIVLKAGLDIVTGERAGNIVVVMLWFVGVIAMQSLSGYMVQMNRVKAVEKTTARLREKLFQHIQRLPLSHLEQAHTGDYMTRLTADVDKAVLAPTHYLFSILSGTVMTIASLAYCFILSWQLTLITLLAMPVSMLIGKWLGPKVQSRFILQQEKESDVRSWMQEVLQNIIVAKSYMAEEGNTDKLYTRNEMKMHASVRRQRADSLLQGFNTLIGGGTFAAIFLGGLLLINAGQITIGSMLGFVQTSNSIIWPFTTMPQLYSELMAQLGAMRRILEVLEIPQETPVTIKAEMASKAIQHVTTMVEGVRFAYQSDGEEVLKGVDLNVKTGEIVGLAGESGSGKSTLAKLLMGLYIPCEGNIRVQSDCGVQASDTNLRQFLALVPQTSALFSGTIAENILLGRPDAGQDEVVEAAKLAGAHDFIMQLPKGYSTHIAEQGGGLSGGQAQRIAIARALLRNTPILIFDESTSALDAESELTILKSIQQIARTRACILVAHRQSMLDICHRVITMEKGRIAKIA